MSTFIIIAGLMTLAALVAVLIPLLRQGAGVRRWSGVLLVLAAVPLLSAALYSQLSNWRWDEAATTASGDIPPMILEMVSRLEQRLKTNPADLDGWLMLGRSYFELDRYQQSADAYRQAYTLSRGTNVEAVLGLGEATFFGDENARPVAQELFNQGLEMSPQHPKALWYTGLIAYEQGDFETARKHWQALAEMAPPEVREMLEAKLAQMEQPAGNISPGAD